MPMSAERLSGEFLERVPSYVRVVRLSATDRLSKSPVRRAGAAKSVFRHVFSPLVRDDRDSTFSRDKLQGRYDQWPRTAWR